MGLAITNEQGTVIEKRLFDAWGLLVKVQDQYGNVLDKMIVLDRGYTGHEHLQSIGIVHMNGRLYDAKLHRFLQPDNFVQDPYNTQNFNRYGYVLNNPLKYTDPSGEWVEWVIGAAIVAVFTYAKGAHDNKNADGSWNWNPSKWNNGATVGIGVTTDLSTPSYTTNATLYVTPTGSSTPLGVVGTQFDLGSGNNPKANTVGGSGDGKSVPCVKCHHSTTFSNGNSSPFQYIEDNQSGFIEYQGGEMMTNFTGGKIGKDGKLYGTASPMAFRGADNYTSYNVVKYFRDFVGGFQNGADLMESLRLNSELDVKTFKYTTIDTIPVTGGYREFNIYKSVEKTGYIINNKDTLKLH